MASARRFVLTAAVALVLGAGSAHAANPLPVEPVLPQAVTSTDFVVHYSDDPTNAAHITQSQAQSVSATAEVAYNTVVSTWAFDAPPLANRPIGIYVTDLSSWHYAYAVVLGPSGLSIDLDPSYVGSSQEITGAVFSVLAGYIWEFDKGAWVSQAAGEWAAMAGANYPSVSESQVGPWDMSLDCDQLSSLTPNSQNCASDFYAGAGQARWPFFEYLSERYGAGILKTLFTSARDNGWTDAYTALSNVIAAKGDTFANVFDQWAAANMAGGYTVKSLQDLLPNPVAVVPTGSLSSLQTGLPPGSPLRLTAPIPSTTVTVGHLATKYLALQPGDGASSDACFAATLQLSVTLPPGAGSLPAFWWSQVVGGVKRAAQSFSVSGSTATLSVPWDTCNWKTTYGYVSLPNPSLNDGQSFVVSGTITVDPTTTASPSAAPTPVYMPGTVIASPTLDVVPTIDLLGPATIHVDSNDTELRVVLSASGPGTVQTTLGSISLGSFPLRAGTNVVHIPLTGPAEQALVAARAAGVTLTLTPLALPGGAGSSIGCTVVLDPLTATTTSSASKAKTKTKTKRHVVRRRARR